MLESKFNKKKLDLISNKPNEQVQKERRERITSNNAQKKEPINKEKITVNTVKREEIFPEIYKSLEAELSYYSSFSEKITMLNQIVSEFIFTRKSNLKESESQLKIQLKQDNENDKFNKQIESEIDKILEKAKKTLNTIKDKKSSVIIEEKQVPIKVIKPTNQNIDLITLVKEKIFYTKYNEKTNINQDNLKTYFGKVAKFKQIYNSCKENLMRVKEHTNFRKLKERFMTTYKANASQLQIKKSGVNFSIFAKANKIYKIGCIIFDNKLKDIFTSNYYTEFKDVYSETEIQKLFTFWFIVNKIKQIIDTESINKELIFDKICKITPQKAYINLIKVKLYSNDEKIARIVNINYTNYLNVLFNISKEKNKSIIEEKLEEIDEEKIFDSDFFDLHNIMKKSVKINLINNSLNILNILNKNNNLSKPEILFFKQLYSIIKNDCQFSFQVTQKLKKK